MNESQKRAKSAQYHVRVENLNKNSKTESIK